MQQAQQETNKQLINHALCNFNEECGCSAAKAKDRWEAKDEKDRTWQNFKQHWKTEIHKFTIDGCKSRQAHQAELDAISTNMHAKMNLLQSGALALQAKNQECQSDDLALNAQCNDIQSALQA